MKLSLTFIIDAVIYRFMVLRGAGACTASHGLAGAALPHSHLYQFGRYDAGKLYVGSVRPYWVALKFRARFEHHAVSQLVGEYHAVGIAHRHSGDLKLAMRRSHRLLYHGAAAEAYGYIGRS